MFENEQARRVFIEKEKKDMQSTCRMKFPKYHRIWESGRNISTRLWLGISREFQDTDSHNAMQALIIADYLKSIKSTDEIDLADMYNKYIKKWNADIYEESYTVCEFKYQSVLSFITILDTLDCLLNMTNITDKSLMMSGDEKLWDIFANSCCWTDVNDKWQNDLLV